MTDDNVVIASFGGSPFKEMESLYEAVWDAVMGFENMVPTMGVVGVLRLIEHRLLTDIHREMWDD